MEIKLSTQELLRLSIAMGMPEPFDEKSSIELSRTMTWYVNQALSEEEQFSPEETALAADTFDAVAQWARAISDELASLSKKLTRSFRPQLDHPPSFLPQNLGRRTSNTPKDRKLLPPLEVALGVLVDRGSFAPVAAALAELATAASGLCDQTRRDASPANAAGRKRADDEFFLEKLFMAEIAYFMEDRGLNVSAGADGHAAGTVERPGYPRTVREALLICAEHIKGDAGAHFPRADLVHARVTKLAHRSANVLVRRCREVLAKSGVRTAQAARRKNRKPVV